MLIALPPPQLVEISGADALAFAQAQFASDSAMLATGAWQWSAWLSAQGRVRALFHLLRTGDARFLLLLRGGEAQRLRDALARYVLRAKVAMRVIADMRALAIEDENLLPLAKGMQIGGDDGEIRIALPGKTARALLLTAQTTAGAADDSAAARNRHALADIDAGLATLDAALEDRLLPHWLALDDLGAISVRKGCYPGQEVVARLHFKGGNKRDLYRIEYRSAALPAPGAAVSAPNSTGDAGMAIASAWRAPARVAALAVLSADTMHASIPLTIDGAAIESIERASAPAGS